MMIVLEVKGNRAVLLDDNGKMQIVRNRNYSVGQSVAYHKTNSVYRACAIAACFVAALFLGTAGYNSYFTAAAYLSVDINPSIQLEINRFERVIGAAAFNDEGNLILDSIKIKNGNVKTAVEKIIDMAEQKGYLTEGDNGVILDISSEKTDIIADISEMIKEYADKNIEVVVEQSTGEDVEIAKSLNVSIGRVKVLREYSEIFGGDIKENHEELKEKSVRELREKNQQKIEEKSNKDNKGNDNNDNNTEQYTDEKDNTDWIKASEKAEKESENRTETKQKNTEKSEKEAQKQIEEAEKESRKQIEEAEKEAEKEARKQAEEAEKRAEEARKRAEDVEKETEKRAKEAEKAADKAEKDGGDKNK